MLLGMSPEQALNLSDAQLFQFLEKSLGASRLKSLLAGEMIPGPKYAEKDGRWLQKSKMVGVHPRIPQTYLGILKYALTCPEEAFHFLPLNEAGAGNSLYAAASWHISREFLDESLSQKGLTTPEQQLKFVISTLHALGKTVGLDIQPHMDRFAETVFTHPDFFEWIQVDSTKTTQIRNDDTLHEDVKKVVQGFLKQFGDGSGKKLDAEVLANFFNPDFINPATGNPLSEEDRQFILFGSTEQPASRTHRRICLMDWVREAGFETVPTPNFYHFRPVRFVKMADNGQGVTWATFEAESQIPTPFPQSSSVFGSIAPFKWFHTKDGMPDLTAPNFEVWEYYADKIVAMQKEFQPDFFRVDRPHLPLRTPQEEEPLSAMGVPYPKNLWAYVKARVAEHNPSVATLAEAFFDPNSCGLDDAFINIETGRFDVALGSLQYQEVDYDFLEKLKSINLRQLYLPISFQTANTMMTADSDKPKFDFMYPGDLANGVRAFVGLFLNQPGYMGMGFETRESQPDNVARQHSCHYIDHNLNGQGKPFLWGKNKTFLTKLNLMRQVYDRLARVIANQSHYWLNGWREGADEAKRSIAAWAFYDAKRGVDTLCVLNTNTEDEQNNVFIENPLDRIPALADQDSQTLVMKPVFSTETAPKRRISLAAIPLVKGKALKLSRLAPGEGRIYRVIRKDFPKPSRKAQQKKVTRGEGNSPNTKKLAV